MMPAPVLADAAVVSAGDTAWVLASTALVMVMTVGLAFFYGGLVRPKNALNTMMMSMVALGLISVQWVLVGYSIGFGHGTPWWGGLAWAGFRGVGLDPDPAYAATIPLQAHAMFQAMFAIITPALISGAIVERMRFRAYVVFLVLWATFVYDPLAHWVWGAGGWLQKLGALDFAGGTVVHISAGVSAFVAARMLGPRKDFKRAPIVPHSVPLVLLGAGLLWFGWFGFNAGSARPANGLAGMAGALLTGVFATKVANPAGGDGWIAGHFAQMGIQLVAVLAAIAIAAVGTAVIMMVVNATLGAKAGVKEQLTGLDLSEHGEEAYFGEQGAIPTPGLALGEGVIVSSVPAEPARAVVVG